MGLDIRWPIGLLFAIFGVFLAGYGIVSDHAIYAHSLGHNVNLSWGIAMLAFGAVMVFYGNRATRRSRAAPPKQPR